MHFVWGKRCDRPHGGDTAAASSEEKREKRWRKGTAGASALTLTPRRPVDEAQLQLVVKLAWAEAGGHSTARPDAGAAAPSAGHLCRARAGDAPSRKFVTQEAFDSELNFCGGGRFIFSIRKGDKREDPNREHSRHQRSVSPSVASLVAW